MDTETRRTWGRNLRAARLAAGVTQVEMAATVGTTQQAISFWESGRWAPTECHRDAAAGVVGVPAEQLFPAIARQGTD